MVIDQPAALAAWSERQRLAGKRVALVPTMGSLHDGHVALITEAKAHADVVIVSIFVNPLQFNRRDDFDAYPRPLDDDLEKCGHHAVDAVYAPLASAMYPEGFQSSVIVPGLARRWEGEARPHHFTGVATVVTKLFGMVRPHLALFGQKDYQQAALVRQLVDDLNLGVAIHMRPTVRERDGLAMSSRNIYLSADERRIAPLLSQTLRAGQQTIEGGMSDVAAVKRIMRQTFEQAPTIQVEYLAVCDQDSLEPLSVVADRAVLLGAVRIGSIRLIDNLLVNMPGGKSRATR